MRLSKTSTHAALAVAFLANSDQGHVVQARQVADFLGIPVDSALKVLQNLARRGIIHSQLGRGGGYRLSRPAPHINLLQVLEATDGPIDADVCLTSANASCAHSLDVLQGVCERVADRVRAELAAISIADLARAQHAPAAPSQALASVA